MSDPIELLRPAATQVQDPVSRKSLWLARMVRQPRVEDGKLRFDLVFTPDHTREQRKAVEEELLAAVRAAGFSGDVVAFPRLERPPPAPAPAKKVDEAPIRGMSGGGGVQPHGGPIQKQPVEGVKHIVCVASGKGGVGKSTVATNLAVGLNELGYAVGLLDADVYGPSLPRMMGVTSRPLVDDERRILPVTAFGVKCLSMGLLVDEDEAIIWRGPMVMSLIRQFLQQARWGDLDVLVVDLPPGTGDAQLTLIQAVDMAGAVIVTTPQEVALADAIRGIAMFKKLEVPLLGLVENMAYYELPDGTRDHVFGQGGGVRVAQQYGTDVLAQLPLKTRLRAAGDDGRPAVLGGDGDAERLMHVARQVAGKLGL